MPTNCTDLVLLARYIASSCGVSVVHGPHHVAQKLMTTTLPSSCASVTSPVPSSRLPVNPPAFFRSLGGFVLPRPVPLTKRNCPP
ncbi:MAG: hypothetical protein QOK11_1573, partial [Pseudonocardiales bacterium]|nr:hypothetical protein [Pseudonocardiales bacterium]